MVGGLKGKGQIDQRTTMIVGLQRLRFSEEGTAELVFELGLDYQDPSKVIVAGGDPKAATRLMKRGVTITCGDAGVSDVLSEMTGVKLPHATLDKPFVVKPDQGKEFLHAVFVRYHRNTGYSAVRPILRGSI